MKIKILSLVSALMLSAAFVACDDEHNYGKEEQRQGKVSFARFSVDIETSETEIASKAEVDVSGFLIKIVNDKDVAVVNTTFGALPDVIALPVGDYKLFVESHQIQKAEFARPYYKGETSFSIKANTISDAGSVTCKFASIRVTIRYSEELLPLLGDDVTVRVRAGESAELVFTPSETRSGYFEAVDGSTTLVAIFQGKVNGYDSFLRKELTDVKVGHHRIITFKVPSMPNPPAPVGGIGVNIGVDASYEDIDAEGNVLVEEDTMDDSDRPGQEEPEGENPGQDDPIDPTPGEVFTVTASDAIDINGVNIPQDGKDYIVTLGSTNGFSNIFVEIISDPLNDEMLRSVGLAANFDLATGKTLSGDLDLSTALGDNFGFPIKDQVVGQTEVVFNISPFVPLLNIYPDNTHVFKLTLKDAKGNQKIVNLTFKS